MDFDWLFPMLEKNTPSEDPCDYHKIYNHVFFNMADGQSFFKKEIEKFRSIKIIRHEIELELTCVETSSFLEESSESLYDVNTGIEFSIGDSEHYYWGTLNGPPDYLAWDLCRGRNRPHLILESNLLLVSKKFGLKLDKDLISGNYPSKFHGRPEKEAARLTDCAFYRWIEKTYSDIIDTNVPGWREDLNNKMKDYILKNDLKEKKDALVIKEVKKQIVSFLFKCSEHIDNKTISDAHQEFLAAQVLDS